MGLATIDPRNHKVQTKLYKIPKFGVIKPNSKQDTAIWKCQNLQKNVWPARHCPTQRPDGHTFLWNRCISVKTSLINTELGDFVNLGVLFLTMWINSCLSNNLQTRTEFFSVSKQAIWLTDLLYLEILCSRREMKWPRLAYSGEREWRQLIFRLSKVWDQ